MTRTGLALAVFALANGCSNCGSSGQPCHVDLQCSASDYCNVGVEACDGGGSILTAGTCTPNCTNGACSCSSDAECPNGLCDNGACHGVGVACAEPPPCAGSGCALQTPPHAFCPICICSSCGEDQTGTDGGQVPDGGEDGGTDAGSCGGSTCGANQFCCTYYGGVHPLDGGGDSSPGCATLGPDGGCPGGGVCQLDDAGMLASCNIYQP